VTCESITNHHPLKMSSEPVTNNTQVLVIDDERTKLYAEIDPPPPATSVCYKISSIVVNLVLLSCVFAFPFVEDILRKESSWGYTPTKFAGLPQLYGLTVIFCIVVPNFVMIYIGFVVTGKGRKKYGYKNPVHYASVDIHVEDVLSGGKLMSNGSVETARRKLDDAVQYSCHQRTHGNTLEWLPTFWSLALIGGSVYPAAASFWGLLWSISRLIWTLGYSTGNPIDRYGNILGAGHWHAVLGCFALAIGAASNMLQQ
jgi:hypothetical protein